MEYKGLKQSDYRRLYLLVLSQKVIFMINASRTFGEDL